MRWFHFLLLMFYFLRSFLIFGQPVIVEPKKTIDSFKAWNSVANEISPAAKPNESKKTIVFFDLDDTLVRDSFFAEALKGFAHQATMLDIEDRSEASFVMLQFCENMKQRGYFDRRFTTHTEPEVVALITSLKARGVLVFGLTARPGSSENVGMTQNELKYLNITFSNPKKLQDNPITLSDNIVFSDGVIYTGDHFRSGKILKEKAMVMPEFIQQLLDREIITEQTIHAFHIDDNKTEIGAYGRESFSHENHKYSANSQLIIFPCLYTFCEAQGNRESFSTIAVDMVFREYQNFVQSIYQ